MLADSCPECLLTFLALVLADSFPKCLLIYLGSELSSFIMPRGKKQCTSCSALNYAFSKQCSSCGVVFSKTDCGRPTNTKACDGYGVSSGRPTNTKESDGYFVGRAGGRPKPLTLMV